MKTYTLDGRGQAVVRRGPMSVEVTLPSEVELTAEVGGHPAAGARYPRPGTVTLPDVAERVVLRVAPRSGFFADGSVLTLRLRTLPARDDVPELVEVRAVDVSRRTFRELVVVEPVDEHRMLVRRLVGPDVELGPLASQARAAARSLLGVDGREEPLAVVVAVDMSASMSSAIADGGVDVAIEAVVGVAQVLSPDHVPAVYLVGREPEQVVCDVPREIAGAVRAAADSAGRGCGFRALAPGLPVHRDTITYIVTDALPPDVDLLATAGADARYRIVLVDSVGAPPGRPPVPVAVLPAPPAGTTVSRYLERSPHAMEGLVGPMVQGFERGSRLR